MVTNGYEERVEALREHAVSSTILPYPSDPGPSSPPEDPPPKKVDFPPPPPRKVKIEETQTDFAKLIADLPPIPQAQPAADLVQEVALSMGGAFLMGALAAGLLVYAFSRKKVSAPCPA